MSEISGNTCSVLTILPLGVECYSINTTTPISNDGAIYLTITGGSIPYNINWSNGSKTNNIYNLIPGNYSVNVVDYYGDYSATTTCAVGSNSFYIKYFSSCTNNDEIYLTGLTENNYTEGNIYKFTNNTGCWIYSGETLWTGQTLTGDTQLSGPFDTCLECNPPIVIPDYPTNICLYSTSGVFTSYPFVFYEFINDKPAYSGTSVDSSGFTINWEPKTTGSYWLLSGKTGQTLTNTNNTFTPVGSWNLLGTQQTWNCISGSCPSAPVLDFTLTTNGETCQNECDGSLSIVTQGGVGGYLYSINGTIYQTTPIFDNLCAQQGTVYVKDSGDTISTKTYIITAGQNRTTYKLSLETKQVNIQTNYGTSVKTKLQYLVKVQPELPNGYSINIPLSVSVVSTEYKPGETTISYTPSLYSGNTLISPLSNTLVKTQNNIPPITSYRYPYPEIIRDYSITYDTVVLRNNVSISGEIETTITKISESGSTCGCSAKKITNLSNLGKNFNWTNCSGGTVNSKISSGQSYEICACSISSVSGLVVEDGTTLNCGNDPGSAKTDGNVSVSVGFNGPSINNGCVVLQVLTPSSGQFNSTLNQTSTLRF
jgi:hypothetical protein